MVKLENFTYHAKKVAEKCAYVEKFLYLCN